MLATKSSFSILNITLLLSPAFLLFPILGPQGAFRKEILFFALFAITATNLVTRKKLSIPFLVFLSLAAVVISLSHEMLIVYFPYLSLAALLQEKRFGNQTKKITLALIPGIVAGIVIGIFAGGSPAAVTRICTSLGNIAPPDCIYPTLVDGAISFLSKDIAFAHSYALDAIRHGRWALYLMLAILSFAPVVLVIFFERDRIFSNKKVRFWSIRFLIGEIVVHALLCWFVADYGRLIYINTVAMSLLVFMNTPEKADKPFIITAKNIPSLLISFVYIFSWRLTYWNASLENIFPLFWGLFK